MKKILLTGAVLASTFAMNAHASQARLLALGMNETDNDGSYYISDARNVFLNPAYVNLYSNEMVLEFGNYGQYAMTDSTSTAKTSGVTLNSNANLPKAQGGFFRKYDNYVYGAYLGNESNTSSLLRAASSSALSAMNGYNGATTDVTSKMLQSSDNQIDLFLGSETNGLKWAGNVLFASGKDDTRSGKDSAIAIRGGVIGSGWDAHLNLSLLSKSEATDTSITLPLLGVTSTSVRAEFKGKIGIQGGGSYVLPVGRVFGYVKHFGWEQTDGYTYGTTVQNNIGGQSGTVKGDFTSIYAGWGNELAVNNGDKVFTSISAKKTDINLKFSNKSEVRHIVIPVTIGYEAKATDWLTLRGSIIQNIWGQYDNKNINNYAATGTRLNKVASGLISNIYGGTGKATVANSTTVNAGATLTFGNFNIDGLVGTTAADNTSNSKKGVLSLSNLETSVAMTYKF